MYHELEIEQKYGNYILRNPELKEQRRVIVEYQKVIETGNLSFFTGL
jgi:hypothetical protein